MYCHLYKKYSRVIFYLSVNKCLICLLIYIWSSSHKTFWVWIFVLFLKNNLIKTQGWGESFKNHPIKTQGWCESFKNHPIKTQGWGVSLKNHPIKTQGWGESFKNHPIKTQERHVSKSFTWNTNFYLFWIWNRCIMY